jgi:hypothetical protein
MYGFAKSDRDNIEDDELKTFKWMAKDRFTLNEEQIKAELEAGKLVEIL